MNTTHFNIQDEIMNNRFIGYLSAPVIPTERELILGCLIVFKLTLQSTFWKLRGNSKTVFETIQQIEKEINKIGNDNDLTKDKVTETLMWLGKTNKKITSVFDDYSFEKNTLYYSYHTTGHWINKLRHRDHDELLSRW